MSMNSGQSMKIVTSIKLLSPAYAKYQIPTISTIIGSEYLYNVFHPSPLLSETGLEEVSNKTCSISGGVKISLEGVLSHEAFYDAKARYNLEKALEKLHLVNIEDFDYNIRVFDYI